MTNFFKKLAVALLPLWLCGATLLPNAVQQFTDGNGTPYANGSVCFYIPSTLTAKTTWTDAGQTTPNTSPCIVLDANGRAQIYGAGQYREILKDAASNTVWDQLTTDVQGLIPIFTGLTSTGSANAQVITYSPAIGPLTPGQLHVFVAGFTNTTATTLTINTTPSSGAISIFKATASGPQALTGNEINANDTVIVYYDGTRYQLIASLTSLSSVNTTIVMNGAAINEASTTITAAATTNIGAAAANYLIVNGSTTITAFDTVQAGTQRTLRFSGTPLLTYNATSLILPGNKSIQTVAGDVASCISEGSGNWRCNYKRQGPGIVDATTLTGYIGGLALSNDGVGPNTIIDTSAGSAVSDDSTTLLTIPAFTKSTAAWAVGTGNGCLDTGTVAASTWYHIFLIERIDTGITDELCSKSTSPSFPTNYTKKRRIGSFKTDSSVHILAFTQTGNGSYREYIWAAAVTDQSGTTIAVSPSQTTLTLPSVPPGFKVDAIVAVTMHDASANVAGLFSPDSNIQGGNLSVSVGGKQDQKNQTIRTDTAQNLLGTSGAAGTTTFDIFTLGWYDFL